MTPIEADQLLGRNLDFVLVAKREEECRDERAQYSEARKPPDVPDQGEAADDGKEGGDEADRAVLRHLDRPVFALPDLAALLRGPERVLLGDLRQHRSE